jgi:hypothetical protein
MSLRDLLAEESDAIEESTEAIAFVSLKPMPGIESCLSSEILS